MRRHNPSKYQSHATAVGPPGRPAWWPLRLHDWAPHVLSVVVGLSKLFLLLLDDGAGFWRGECVRLFLRAVLCDAVAIAEGRERQRNVVQLERSLVIFRVMSCHAYHSSEGGECSSQVVVAYKQFEPQGSHEDHLRPNTGRRALLSEDCDVPGHVELLCSGRRSYRCTESSRALVLEGSQSSRSQGQVKTVDDVVDGCPLRSAKLKAVLLSRRRSKLHSGAGFPAAQRAVRGSALVLRLGQLRRT